MEIIAALAIAQSRGVRGGGIYDYMHLVAAIKAKVSVLHTLNMGDFLHLRREADPEIEAP